MKIFGKGAKGITDAGYDVVVLSGPDDNHDFQASVFDRDGVLLEDRTWINIATRQFRDPEHTDSYGNITFTV